MDETTLLDTDLLCDLLHAVADSEAPVCEVSIARAKKTGGRQRAVRHLHLPWVAPIAAAAAVAVIAAVAVPSGGNDRSRPPSSAASQPVLRRVPSEFTAQSPTVTFGWLPPGFDANGVADLPGGGPTGTELDLQVAAPDGRALFLVLHAAGQCRIGGPVRAPASAAVAYLRERDRHGQTRKLTYQHYPLSFSCGKGALPLVRQVAPVGGGLAYQDPRGGLFWEYGRNAWASLDPGLSPGDLGARLSGRLTGTPVVWPSAASWPVVRRAASRLRVSTAAAHPLYGFTLTGLPASWGTGYQSGMAILKGQLAADGWSTTGPAVDPGALGISVWPAPGQTPGEPPLSCNFVPRESSYITVDGARATLRIMGQVGKDWQSLCIPDVDGLSVYIEMDVWSEGADNKPLPGWPSQGVLAMFRHMQLLGPDVSNWTTDPQH